MVTEMITLKLDNVFLKEIDKVVKNNGYQNRTEFIRNALREKVEESKLKEAMIQIAHLKGAAKKNVTKEKYEKTRQDIFKEFEKKLK